MDEAKREAWKRFVSTVWSESREFDFGSGWDAAMHEAEMRYRDVMLVTHAAICPYFPTFDTKCLGLPICGTPVELATVAKVLEMQSSAGDT